MSTPLTDGINALTAYANETTGASDTTLSDAVGRLCEGYGGGIPSSLLAIADGEATISADNNNITVTTNLGYRPDLAIMYVKNPDFLLIPYDSCVFVCYARDIYTNAPNYVRYNYQYWYRYKHATSGNLLQGTSYGYVNDLFLENELTFVRGNSPWRANDVNGNPIVYKWVAFKIA